MTGLWRRGAFLGGAASVCKITYGAHGGGQRWAGSGASGEWRVACSETGRLAVSSMGGRGGEGSAHGSLHDTLAGPRSVDKPRQECWWSGTSLLPEDTYRWVHPFCHSMVKLCGNRPGGMSSG